MEDENWASLSQVSFERFIQTINKEQAKDLVRSINLWVAGT